MTFSLCCCCCFGHGPELLFPCLFFFQFDKSLVEWNGKTNGVSMHVKWSGAGGMVVVQIGGMCQQLCPLFHRGCPAAVRAVTDPPQHLPTSSYWFVRLAVNLGSLLPQLRPHFVRGCWVHFYASPRFLSHPNLYCSSTVIVRLWNVPLSFQLSLLFSFSLKGWKFDACHMDTWNLKYFSGIASTLQSV